MKEILSISLGSSSRDHTTRQEILGEEFLISRKGTDGDFERALELYGQYDGQVEAFGVGGAEFYLEVGDRRYTIRDARRIRAAIKKSKVGDGNGVKGLLAQRAIRALERHLNGQGKTLVGMPTLQTMAVDRFFLAETLVTSGCLTTFADFMFTMGLPIAVQRLATIRLIAAVLLPILTRLPYMWFYPLGSQQDQDPVPRWQRYYQESKLIAGDFLQIRRYMPPDLSGKIILTNTTTAQNIEELQARGLHMLVTTTPRLEGRSFGTNVMEATLLTLMDKPQAEVTSDDFLRTHKKNPSRTKFCHFELNVRPFGVLAVKQ